ncbi:MAG TPA: hypothetical protein PLS51_05755 [Flavobacterium sp.]|nr:hypothetical protein [Flavobacterium sp.]HPJ10114.1 hypothetical protein [Flavobacterium sp.]
MKNTQLLVLFLIGAVLTLGGVLLKIMAIEPASLLLIVGMTFEGVTGVLLIYKSVKDHNRKDSFLDS